MPPAVPTALGDRCTALAGGALLGALLLARAAAAQPAAGHYPYFPADAPWTQDISTAPVDLQSSAVIAWLASQSTSGGATANQGWGKNQIDFSLEVLEAIAATPLRSFSPTADFYSPDCDFTTMPVPVGGVLEGETGYHCASDGDCHLLVVDRLNGKLYEMWRADIVGANFVGGCLAVWNMKLTYPPAGRGQDCTSGDAAGYPISPLLFNADEVAAGHIDHAIRFVLPNNRIRAGIYVHPSTHSTGPTSGPATAPPYGARLRLRANFPLGNLPNGPARIVAQAMQKYGILLADGGNLAWTGQSDRFTTAKWATVGGTGLGVNDLDLISAADFSMIAAGPRYTYTGDCARTTPIFNDGFEIAIVAKWNGQTPP